MADHVFIPDEVFTHEEWMKHMRSKNLNGNERVSTLASLPVTSVVGGVLGILAGSYLAGRLKSKPEEKKKAEYAGLALGVVVGALFSPSK